MSDTQRPELCPTGTDLGAAVRHLLDTGDLSGVPWILDTLRDLGRDDPTRVLQWNMLRNDIAKVSEAGEAHSGDGRRPTLRHVNAHWDAFRESVRFIFWLDLYTLESVLAVAGRTRQGAAEFAAAQGRADSWNDPAWAGVLDGSEDVLSHLSPENGLTDPRD